MPLYTEGLRSVGPERVLRTTASEDGDGSWRSPEVGGGKGDPAEAGGEAEDAEDQIGAETARRRGWNGSGGKGSRLLVFGGVKE